MWIQELRRKVNQRKGRKLKIKTSWNRLPVLVYKNEDFSAVLEPRSSSPVLHHQRMRGTANHTNLPCPLEEVVRQGLGQKNYDVNNYLEAPIVWKGNAEENLPLTQRVSKGDSVSGSPAMGTDIFFWLSWVNQRFIAALFICNMRSFQAFLDEWWSYALYNKI